MAVVEVKILSDSKGHTVSTFCDGVLIHAAGPFADYDFAYLNAKEIAARVADHPSAIVFKPKTG